MPDPYLSELRVMSGGIVPTGWAACDGQLLNIADNPALYSLLGTRFGGDGITQFGLPDLRARVPLHIGPGHALAEKGGEQAHALTIAEMPWHTHDAQAADIVATVTAPDSSLLVAVAALNMFLDPAQDALVPMEPGIIGQAGASLPHPNMQPFLALNFCISLKGIYPKPG